MSEETAIDTSEPIAVGPTEENGGEVLYVTFPEAVSEGEVHYTIGGESQAIPIDSDLLTTKADRRGLGRRMIEKFEDSRYIKLMEVTTTKSGIININGV